MADLTNFDPNSAGNPNNNIFGLPFSEDDARVVILPVPWEVSVSYGAGTARAPEGVFNASYQVDLMDNDLTDGWRKGIYMREPDQELLLKSDHLRDQAEEYIQYISEGNSVEDNPAMAELLNGINEGSKFLNNWVYIQAKELLEKGKLVGLLGGDHSTPLGYMKAIGERYETFGILQIDAHCDLREAYEDMTYSHASIMYNALKEIPNLVKLVQVGTRDYSDTEYDYMLNSNGRVNTFFDKDIKERLYEGETWKAIVDDVIAKLPEHVYLSFDIDGLDPKLCPNTGTPVQGGLETEQVYYLLRKMLKAGKKLVAFDLNEVGSSDNEWDENVGARVLYKLCNLLLLSNE
ncbi:MAG: agmatinase family protein [Chitinophagaceae bacterium]|nr:agmatinase family protein [Chitinophagaceae bacterium]